MAKGGCIIKKALNNDLKNITRVILIIHEKYRIYNFYPYF